MFTCRPLGFATLHTAVSNVLFLSTGKHYQPAGRARLNLDC